MNDVHVFNVLPASCLQINFFVWFKANKFRTSGKMPEARYYEPLASFKNGITFFSNSAVVNFNTSLNGVASTT